MGKYRSIILRLVPSIAVFAMLFMCKVDAYADDITISTDGAVNVEVMPSVDGALGVARSVVTISSDTAGNNYNLYIAGASAEDDGYTPLYFNGNSQSSSKIKGLHTSDSPLPFTFDSSFANSWGYAVPSASGAGFSSDNDYDALANSSTTDSSKISNLTWKGVKSDYGLVKTGTTSASEEIPVYFGVYVNKNMMSGNYQNTIVYTAFVEEATPTMQEFSSKDATALNVGDTITLRDSRDNKKYLVRKLADGNVWMVQNLALEGGQTITSSNSNLPDGVSYDIPDGAVATNKFSSNTAEDMYNGSSDTGAYYNWNIATAGYDAAGKKSSGNSDRSICPKGWRLPTSTDSGEFQALYKTYGNNKTNFDAAFNSAFVGLYNYGSLYSSGSSAYWWSSTISSITNAYSLYEHSSGDINPSNNFDRRVGLSVRCVLDTPTMQEFSSENAATLNIGDTITLRDARDGKKYLIRKLADGRVWMVQNLALTGGRTITSSDSNLPNGVSYNIPSGTTYTGKFSSNTAEDMYNGSSDTGAYYNWNVATAGYDTAGKKSSGEADRSICPKGWHLPTGNTDSEFQTLYVDGYGSNTSNLEAAFNNTIYLGYYEKGSLRNSDSTTLWWSSTIYNAADAYRFNINSNGNISFSNYTYRHYGFLVRCVADL